MWKMKREVDEIEEEEEEEKYVDHDFATILNIS